LTKTHQINFDAIPDFLESEEARDDLLCCWIAVYNYSRNALIRGLSNCYDEKEAIEKAFSKGFFVRYIVAAFVYLWLNGDRKLVEWVPDWDNFDDSERAYVVDNMEYLYHLAEKKIESLSPEDIANIVKERIR
jgi:hypothetical protein